MAQKSDQSANNLRVGLVLLSVFLLMAGYYLIHKPFVPETGTALGWIAWRFLVVLLILCLSGTIGRRLNLTIETNRAASMVIQTASGLGILSILILIMGSALGINWITLLLLPLVLLVLWRKYLLAWLRSFYTAITEIWRETGMFEKSIAGLIGIVLAATLVMALAPPIKYDTLMYHLTMPQSYVQQGRITHLPWLVMTGMPQSTEMLFTMAFWLGGSPAAALTGWLIGCLALLGIIAFFHSGFDKGGRLGWVAAASLLAGETFASSLAWAYVDWTGLLFGVCCLVCLFTWFNTDQAKYAGMAGLFAGMAFTTKYTGGILFLCSLVALIVQLSGKKRVGGNFDAKTLLYFIAAAGIFPLFWFARNLLLTGNPVYPFFFPAAQMDALRLGVYQGAEPYGAWWEGLLLPVRASLWGLESAEGYSVSIGPLLLLLGLANVLRNRQLKPTEADALRLGLIFFLSAWIFWALGNRLSGYLIQTRMYFSLFPAFAVLAALGWDAVSDIRWQGIHLRRVFGVVIFLALGISTGGTLLQAVRQDAPRAAAGLISEDAYLDANLGWYAPAVKSVNRLPAGSKTLFLYEPRGLACVPGCDPDEILDQWKISRVGYATDESVIRYWKLKGYNYLLVNLAGMNFLADGSDAHHPADEVRALRVLLEEIPVVQTFGESYTIYKLP